MNFGIKKRQNRSKRLSKRPSNAKTAPEIQGLLNGV